MNTDITYMARFRDLFITSMSGINIPQIRNSIIARFKETDYLLYYISSIYCADISAEIRNEMLNLLISIIQTNIITFEHSIQHNHTQQDNNHNNNNIQPSTYQNDNNNNTGAYVNNTVQPPQLMIPQTQLLQSSLSQLTIPQTPEHNIQTIKFANLPKTADNYIIPQIMQSQLPQIYQQSQTHQQSQTQPPQTQPPQTYQQSHYSTIFQTYQTQLSPLPQLPQLPQLPKLSENSVSKKRSYEDEKIDVKKFRDMKRMISLPKMNKVFKATGMYFVANKQFLDNILDIVNKKFQSKTIPSNIEVMYDPDKKINYHSKDGIICFNFDGILIFETAHDFDNYTFIPNPGNYLSDKEKETNETNIDKFCKEYLNIKSINKTGNTSLTYKLYNALDTYIKMPYAQKINKNYNVVSI